MHDSTIIGSLVNVLLPFLTSNDCKLMGAQTCFNLAQYQSFPIGTVDPNNAQNFIDSSKGFFISMQSQNVQWRDQQDPPSWSPRWPVPSSTCRATPMERRRSRSTSVRPSMAFHGRTPAWAA